MRQYDRMIAGELYSCAIKDEYREKLYRNCVRFMDEFNSTSYGDFEKREQLVRGLFASVGENCCINKPFYCDYGCHISVGDNFYANYDCIILDINRVTIGNNVMFAPRVCVYAAGHPIDKDVRNSLLEYGREVTIGDDVWVGGNTVINPGVKIGSNVVIGSNSVVTNDIPDGVIAAGNPCKVIRKITEDDKLFWEEQAKKFYLDMDKQK